MRPTFIGKEIEIVERGLADPKFREAVEFETGKTVKVKVDWTARTITIQRPRMGRVLNLDEFIAASRQESGGEK